MVFLFVPVLVVFSRSGWSANPFTVVELFSSEGCSSCPPADELLRNITQEAALKNQRVYTLSYQVDYWNYLGWTDPYSRPEFTQRQYQYIKIFGGDSVYTPQMVINGQKTFVGTDSFKAQTEIENFLKVSSDLSLDLELTARKSDVLQIRFRCNKISLTSRLTMALVRREVESRVTSGENKGRLLKHVNVVGQLQTLQLTQETGIVTFNIPSTESMTDYSVVAFIQDSKTMIILAAQQVAVK